MGCRGIPLVWAGAVELVGWWWSRVRGIGRGRRGRPVRFGDAVVALRSAGVGTFVEVGPGGTLSVLGPAALAGPDGWLPRRCLVPVLRRDREEPVAVLQALGEVWVRGVGVDWAGGFGWGGSVWSCRRMRLSGSVFGWVVVVGWRMWLRLGLSAAGHPLLGAAVELPATGGLVLTGRLSVSAQPWLGDHVVAGRVLVPGTALAEMAVRAGDEAGCGRVEELLVEVPLVLPARGGVQVQVTVGAAGEGGGAGGGCVCAGGGWGAVGGVDAACCGGAGCGGGCGGGGGGVAGVVAAGGGGGGGFGGVCIRRWWRLGWGMGRCSGGAGGVAVRG